MVHHRGDLHLFRRLQVNHDNIPALIPRLERGEVASIGRKPPQADRGQTKQVGDGDSRRQRRGGGQTRSKQGKQQRFSQGQMKRKRAGWINPAGP